MSEGLSVKELKDEKAKPKTAVAPGLNVAAGSPEEAAITAAFTELLKRGCAESGARILSRAKESGAELAAALAADRKKK